MALKGKQTLIINGQRMIVDWDMYEAQRKYQEEIERTILERLAKANAARERLNEIERGRGTR